jgi:zinc carboxypeptidase
MLDRHRQTAHPIGRRRLLAAGGGLALSLLAVGAAPARAQSSLAPLKRMAVGRSRGGRQIVSYHLGGGRRRVLVLGGQHGSPEANTVTLADAIVDHFWHDEADIPRGVGLDIIPLANPDGYISGRRQFLSGVDPNRNWASGDWEPDAYDSLGQFWNGLGGPVPMSEPETRVLASWITRYRPVLVVNYHSAGGFVSTSQAGISWDLADVYGEASGYPSYGPDRPPFGYSITGAMDGWLAARGIADLFVELSTLEDPEVDENLAGLTAVLARLAP